MKEEQHVSLSFSKKRMTSRLRLSHFRRISACEAMNTWAALVIMMHDMPKHYWGNGKESQKPENPILRLAFEKDSISYIVSVADIMEEFNRPWSEFMHIDKDEKKGIDEHVRVNYVFA